ncbi:MAG: hypothetical protein EBQ75_08420, partial [Actinobacteria bacterium]|nr:hypothetical protein [Actinomycetota bacterium]
MLVGRGIETYRCRRRGSWRARSSCGASCFSSDISSRRTSFPLHWVIRTVLGCAVVWFVGIRSRRV